MSGWGQWYLTVYKGALSPWMGQSTNNLQASTFRCGEGGYQTAKACSQGRVAKESRGPDPQAGQGTKQSGVLTPVDGRQMQASGTKGKEVATPGLG